MFCPNCGTNNADGVKFCSGCGAPMGTNNAAPVEPTPVYAPVEPTPVQPQTPFYAPVEPQAPVYAPVAPAPAPQKPKKSNTGLIVGLIVGVLVIIGAVIAILFATGTFDTDSKKEETTTEETDKKQNKDENKDEDKEENKEEGTTEQEQIDEPVVGQKVEFGKVSMIASNDLVGNGIGVGDGKMYTYNDYPARTDNFTIETVVGASDYITEDDIANMYSMLNLSSYEMKSFNTYAVSGFKYTKAVVAASLNGVNMYADIYIIFVDGQCVMITFNSLGNTTSSGFADEIASIRVNGSALPY